MLESTYSFKALLGEESCGLCGVSGFGDVVFCVSGYRCYPCLDSDARKKEEARLKRLREET